MEISRWWSPLPSWKSATPEIRISRQHKIRRSVKRMLTSKQPKPHLQVILQASSISIIKKCEMQYRTKRGIMSLVQRGPRYTAVGIYSDHVIHLTPKRANHPKEAYVSGHNLPRTRPQHPVSRCLTGRNIPSNGQPSSNSPLQLINLSLNLPEIKRAF